MPTPKQPEPRGVDVRLRPRPDIPHEIRTYRVTDDGAVFVHCEFTNWAGNTRLGIPPGGRWTTFRKLGSQNGPLAREARRMAKIKA